MMNCFFISLPHFQFDKENITTKAIGMELFKNLGNMNHIDPSVYERADEGLLKQKNVPVELISEFTQLSKEEIEAILRDNSY